jgi:hypothetical protein
MLVFPAGLASMHGQSALQSQDTPIIEIGDKHPRIHLRGRKMFDRTQGFGDMR